MKPMNTHLPEEWNDLPKISARSAPLLDSLMQCAIAENGCDQITLFLPADGLVALIEAPKKPASEHLHLALGRIVAAHARASTARLDPAGFFPEPPVTSSPAQAIATGNPNVVGRASQGGQGVTQCWLGAGGEAALVFLMSDGLMPLVWASFSNPDPSNELLVAVAAVLVAHRSACAEGRVFP